MLVFLKVLFMNLNLYEMYEFGIILFLNFVPEICTLWSLSIILYLVALDRQISRL